MKDILRTLLILLTVLVLLLVGSSYSGDGSNRLYPRWEVVDHILTTGSRYRAVVVLLNVDTGEVLVVKEELR